jgi:hypothetical protein
MIGMDGGFPIGLAPAPMPVPAQGTSQAGPLEPGAELGFLEALQRSLAPVMPAPPMAQMPQPVTELIETIIPEASPFALPNLLTAASPRAASLALVAPIPGTLAQAGPLVPALGPLADPEPTLPTTPHSSSVAWLELVRTVTPRIFIRSPASATAAAHISGPPLRWIVHRSAPNSRAERTAEATVLGMSCNFRSKNTRAPCCFAASSAAGPAEEKSCSPTL